MAEKKKETKKIEKRAIAAPKAPSPVAQEDVYPAIQIAEILGVSSFDFFIVKRAKNIDDDTLLTMSKFQKFYQEAVEGR